MFVVVLMFFSCIVRNFCLVNNCLVVVKSWNCWLDFS